MKLALHTIGYAGMWGDQARLSVDDILDRAVALSYDGVMLTAKRPQYSPLDMDAYARSRLRSALDRRGLKLAAVAGYTDFCAGYDHPDVPLHEAQITYVAEMARLAHDLGSSVLRIFTGFERPGVAFDTQWNGCVEAVRECAARAAEHGVVIGIQNHHDIAVHFESAMDFLRDVDHPNCRLCFDAWSAALHGVDLRSVARLVAPVTVHTTVADYVRRPRYSFQPGAVNYSRQADVARAVPMGEGFIDYDAFFAGLREGGYPDEAWVAYEMCSPLAGGGSVENLDRHARQFVVWMRTHGLASGEDR